MIVDDLINGFYEPLVQDVHGHILILTTLDVDSLCTVKILQQLFRIDSISTILKPVNDYKDLKKAYADYADRVKNVLLVNCCATLDILSFFENIPTDVRFFVIDDQRPISVFNIYDASKRVRVVAFAEEETFPPAEDVFVDVSEDEGLDSDDEDDLSLDESIRFMQVQNRRRKRQAAQARRQQQMAEKLQSLYDYTQYHYYSYPSSYLALRVAMDIGQATPDVIWWAAVGVSHSFQMRRIERHNYCKLVAFIEGEVSRIAHKNHNTRFDFKISMINDLDLILYKNWSVWDSSNSTPNWILTFLLWTEAGLSRLKLFFAESGLPHAKLKLNYPYMPKEMKNKLEPAIRKREEKYNIKNWLVGTFLAKYGCQYTFTALDIQMAVIGIMDNGSPQHVKPITKFLDGLECLKKDEYHAIKHGISLSQKMLTDVFKQVRLLLVMDLVIAYASVLVCKFIEREFNFKYNTSTSYLKLFTKFAQQAYIVEHKVRKYKHMPFVVIVPIDHDHVLVVGESPLSYDSPRTQFKRIFEMVAKKMNEPEVVSLDNFDPSFCKVKAEYRDEFVEHLVSVLTP